MSFIGSVVSGHKYMLLTYSIYHLLLHYESIMISGADDDIHIHSVLLKPFGLRINGSSAQTSADKKIMSFPDLFYGLIYIFRRISKRTDHINEAVSRLLFGDLVA